MPWFITCVLALSLISFVAYGFPLLGSNETNSLGSRARRQVIHPLSQYRDLALAEIIIGGQKLHLLVDTGSSQTWVKDTSLANANLGKSIGTFVQTYANGEVASGKQYKTTVTLPSDLEAEDQIIGIADKYSEGDAYHKWDGVMGLSISTDEKEAPSIFENLADSGQIPRSISVFYKPVNENDEPELVWGGYNALKTKGGLSYAPMTTDAFAKAEMNWGVDAAIKYKGQIIQKVRAAYLDTGSSTIDLPNDAYRKFADATGAVPNGDIMLISQEEYAAMEDLVIVIKGREWPLIPNALKEADNLDEDGDVEMGRRSSKVVLRVNPMDETQTAFGFGLGAPFFERYYMHLDDGKQRIGIGRTPYTQSESN